jgi:hypothetical protein
VHEILRNFYPEHYAELKTLATDKVVSLSYNAIYAFSVCQIVWNKLLRQWLVPLSTAINAFCSSFIGPNYKTNAYKTNAYTTVPSPIFLIQVFAKGHQVCSELTDISNLNEIPISMMASDYPGCDMLVISDLRTNPINRYCMYHCFDNWSVSYEPSEIKFISILLVYEGNQYSFDLFTPEWNYYFKGNVIGHDFVRYYIINKLHINSVPQKIKYTLEIIDHNVNMITVDETKDIVIHKDTYEIQIKVHREQEPVVSTHFKPEQQEQQEQQEPEQQEQLEPEQQKQEDSDGFVKIDKP